MIHLRDSRISEIKRFRTTKFGDYILYLKVQIELDLERGHASFRPVYWKIELQFQLKTKTLAFNWFKNVATPH